MQESTRGWRRIDRPLHPPGITGKYIPMGKGGSAQGGLGLAVFVIWLRTSAFSRCPARRPVKNGGSWVLRKRSTPAVPATGKIPNGDRCLLPQNKGLGSRVESVSPRRPRLVRNRNPRGPRRWRPCRDRRAALRRGLGGRAWSSVDERPLACRSGRDGKAARLEVTEDSR